MSSLARAEIIINKERILLVPSRQTWLVQGSTGIEYAVQLFRNGSYDPICPCPATTTTCCHILACLKSIGLDPNVAVSKKQRNTRKLLSNTKPVNSRRTGQKKPNATERARQKFFTPDETADMGLDPNSHWDMEMVLLHFLNIFSIYT